MPTPVASTTMVPRPPHRDPLEPYVTNRGVDKLHIRQPQGTANTAAPAIQEPETLEDVQTLLEESQRAPNDREEDEEDEEHKAMRQCEGPPFIPISCIRQAINTKFVSNFLKENDLPPEYCNKICYGSPGTEDTGCTRIMTILINIDKPESIKEFIEAGINDSHLPLECDKGKAILYCAGPIDLRLDLSKSRPAWLKKHCRHFYQEQWATIAPFFYKPDDQAPHYVLHEKDAPPFTMKRTVDMEDDDESEEEEEEALDAERGQTRILGGGGFADVYCTKVHKEYQDFGNLPLAHKDGWLAIKRLRIDSPRTFREEVQMLKRISNTHAHLIPLILTYDQPSEAGRYHFVFPWATSDMRGLWVKERTGPYYNDPFWLLNQCYGITDALSLVHNDYNQQEDPTSQVPKFGRHGDIKPDNILLFENYVGADAEGPRLVLADFGFGRFHRWVSRSQKDPKKTPKSPTYKAPEFELKGGRITRRADIWSLACTFLELMTWFLKGRNAVWVEFEDKRESNPDVDGGAQDNNEIKSDMYFQTNTKGSRARVKPAVVEWIGELHNCGNSSPALHQFLVFIEERMMTIDQQYRATSHEVATFLKELVDESARMETIRTRHDNCQANRHSTMDTQCTCKRPKPAPWELEAVPE